MPESNVRLFTGADLKAGAEISLEAGQSHYLAHVMRLTPGRTALLFNGRDGEWAAVIEELTKKRCRVRIESCRRRQELEPDLWLVFAPVKKNATDFIVEKATELGVSRLCPVFTAFTATTRFNRDRLDVHAVEAAEQCRRMSVPHVDEAVSLDRLLEGWSDDRQLLVADESGSGKPITKVADEFRGGSRSAMSGYGLLIGPEGGFSDAERDQLSRREIVTMIDLGPRILRAETAAVSALACWQALIGDWYGISHT